MMSRRILTTLMSYHLCKWKFTMKLMSKMIVVVSFSWRRWFGWWQQPKLCFMFTPFHKFRDSQTEKRAAIEEQKSPSRTVVSARWGLCILSSQKKWSRHFTGLRYYNSFKTTCVNSDQRANWTGNWAAYQQRTVWYCHCSATWSLPEQKSRRCEWFTANFVGKAYHRSRRIVRQWNQG